MSTLILCAARSYAIDLKEKGLKRMFCCWVLRLMCYAIDLKEKGLKHLRRDPESAWDFSYAIDLKEKGLKPKGRPSERLSLVLCDRPEGEGIETARGEVVRFVRRYAIDLKEKGLKLLDSLFSFLS